MARIVLNTFGSFGDIHPYLAVAIGLKQRGHDSIIGTSEIYRQKIMAEGIGFAPVRPDIGELLGNAEFLKRLWDPLRGTENLIRRYLLPAVEHSYADLLPACEGADLLLTHIAAYAGPIVADKLHLRWLSVILQPLGFLSVFDRPTIAPFPLLNELGFLGPGYYRLLFLFADKHSGSFAGPIMKIRQREGLGAPRGNPLFGGWFSPHGTLALFSRHFAPPQPDWPPNVTICGFPFFDRFGSETCLDRDLESFLDGGQPPVLFTLGSSAVMHPGSFFQESFEAARGMKIRAVLLTGALSNELFPKPWPENICIAGYAPYSLLMPRCAATVHQAGIGTVAQALRAGRPMISVPWSHDQPDNAERLQRLGVSRIVKRSRYTAARVARNLEALLGNARYSQNAARFGAAIRNENAVKTACDAIERALQSA